MLPRGQNFVTNFHSLSSISVCDHIKTQPSSLLEPTEADPRRGTCSGLLALPDAPRCFLQPLLLTPPRFASGLSSGKPSSFLSLVLVPPVEIGLWSPWAAVSAIMAHQLCAGGQHHLQGRLISLHSQKTAPKECLSLPVPCAGGGAKTQRWQSQGRNPDPSGPSQAPEHGPRSWGADSLQGSGWAHTLSPTGSVPLGFLCSGRRPACLWLLPNGMRLLEQQGTLPDASVAPGDGAQRGLQPGSRPLRPCHSCALSSRLLSPISSPGKGRGCPEVLLSFG